MLKSAKYVNKIRKYSLPVIGEPNKDETLYSK